VRQPIPRSLTVRKPFRAKKEGWKQLEIVLPLERWFRKQREGLGYEAWTYAMIRVARVSTILQGTRRNKVRRRVYDESTGLVAEGRYRTRSRDH
jgi:hypothetical protein